MSVKGVLKRALIVAAGTWIGQELKLLMPMLRALMALMIIDYISGMLAAKKEALEYPENPSFGWSSRRSRLGIYKKMGYIACIFAAAGTDYLLWCLSGEQGLKSGGSTVFSLLVTAWFMINELLSILENAGRMGVELPMFLRRVLSELKKDIDNTKESGK